MSEETQKYPLKELVTIAPKDKPEIELHLDTRLTLPAIYSVAYTEADVGKMGFRGLIQRLYTKAGKSDVPMAKGSEAPAVEINPSEALYAQFMQARNGEPFHLQPGDRLTVGPNSALFMHMSKATGRLESTEISLMEEVYLTEKYQNQEWKIKQKGRQERTDLRSTVEKRPEKLDVGHPLWDKGTTQL